MTARPNAVGQLHSAARRIAPPVARRNLSELSFPAGAPFKRSKVFQAMIDVAAVLVAFLLISTTAVSIAGAAFILFFVSL